MSKLLATIAATAPMSVEFHIHQVVDTFQMSMPIKTYPKNVPDFLTSSDKIINGTKAMQISKVNCAIGQEAISSIPVKMDNPNRCVFLNGMILVMGCLLNYFLL